MAIYDFKDFLTIDDVAEYLRDNDIYDFDLSNEYHQKRLQSFIINLINERKLTALFHYNGLVVNFSESIKHYDNFHDIVDIYIGFFKASNDMIRQWLDGYVIHFSHKEYIPNLIIPEITVKDVYTSFQEIPKAYALLNPPPRKGVDLLFAKSQLNAIFQSNTTDKEQLLQAKDNEIAALNARIATLEQKQAGTDKLHTRTANNASKIILAMAELLQWDLSEPYGKDTNGKIREVLDKQGNELSKDTVALWLKQAYDIGK